MALSDLSSMAAVLYAIEEFDQLGQSRLLDLYKFGSASRYMVLFQGGEYDSKAVARVAHKLSGNFSRHHAAISTLGLAGSASTERRRNRSIRSECTL